MNFVKRIVKEELPFILACPALIWQIFFIYFPLFVLFFYSFLQQDRFAFYLKFTFNRYIDILTSHVFKVIVNSFFLALVTSVLCLFIAYPVAYFLAMKVKKRFKTFLLFSLILPSWASFIVQVYAWFFLLQKKGFFSLFLYKIGIISQNTHLLNNKFSILVGTVYCFLPFMIFPIYTVLEKMDKILIEASADLGANQFQTFRKVIFPLSFNGVIAGFLLVFIAVFGEFAVPDLLGGGKIVFWGTIIVEKFLMSKDWQSGSALTIIGILFLVLFFFLISFIYKFFRKLIKTRI